MKDVKELSKLYRVAVTDDTLAASGAHQCTFCIVFHWIRPASTQSLPFPNRTLVSPAIGNKKRCFPRIKDCTLYPEYIFSFVRIGPLEDAIKQLSDNGNNTSLGETPSLRNWYLKWIPKILHAKFAQRCVSW